jgi:hypothetical protein
MLGITSCHAVVFCKLTQSEVLTRADRVSVSDAKRWEQERRVYSKRVHSLARADYSYSHQHHDFILDSRHAPTAYVSGPIKAPFTSQHREVREKLAGIARRSTPQSTRDRSNRCPTTLNTCDEPTFDDTRRTDQSRQPSERASSPPPRFPRKLCDGRAILPRVHWKQGT